MTHVEWWLILLFSLISSSFAREEDPKVIVQDDHFDSNFEYDDHTNDYLDEKMNLEENLDSPASDTVRYILAFIITIISAWFVWQGLTPTDVILGVPFHKHLTKIKWPESSLASNTKTFTVSFSNFKGVPLKNPIITGNLTVEVLCNQIAIPMTSLIESENEEEACIVFNSTRAGCYIIVLKSNGKIVRGFPLVYTVLAEDVDPLRTLFYRLRSHTLILTAGVPEDLKLSPHDKFGNSLETSQLPDLTDRISFQLWHMNASDGGRRREVGTGQNCIVYLSESGILCISIAFASGEEGWYVAIVQLDKKPIQDGELTIIVLSRNEKSKVDRIVNCRRGREFYSSPDLDYFEADLIATHGQRLEKPKKVYCYLTDKQLSIREYFLKIFLKRTFTYRLVPATKLKLLRYEANAPVLTIEDGFQRSFGPEICLRDLLLVACFHSFLLHKIGGSETFDDKKNYFYNKLLTHHHKKSHKHTPLNLKISRFPSILKSSISQTKSMSDQEWAKLFVIEFEGERGIDQGGLRREWLSLLTKELFDVENGLFVQVEPGGSAVMPNPFPPPNVKTRPLYKFAGKIVGKCLYESSYGITYSQYLPVRLAKSFLAQLVGLRVNFRHFADDAPELYASKIRFIENTNIDDPESGLDDLTFSEEVHEKGSGVNIVDLKPQGRYIRVSEDVKMEYLDLLAQYRLSDCMRDNLGYFLEGLHTFVPDTLLCMFDENELELLLCGVREYSLTELKKHNIIVSGLSSKLKRWFWMALSHFTPEQFARLLQFTTGSSQLPPGGFSDLKPLFQIAPTHKQDSLPVAHTCFNMICLSDHSSFQSFEKALLTAINDGSEGFELE